jgi:hypothetical protein
MSPVEACPGCGRDEMFHEDELDDLRKGETLCVECTLERCFNVFLAEVLAGEHKELIAELRERLAWEHGWE